MIKFSFVFLILSLFFISDCYANSLLKKSLKVQERYDFGIVDEGTLLELNIAIKSLSEKEINFLSYTADNCVKVKLPASIKSHELIKVKITWNTTDILGYTKSKIVIKTTDNLFPDYSIDLFCLFEKPSPDVYNFGVIEEGDVIFCNFNIFAKDEAIIIKRTQLSCGSCLSVTERPDKIEKGKASKIKIRLNSSGKKGYTVQRVRVVTDSKEQPEYFFTMRGLVRSIWTEPQEVIFGNINDISIAKKEFTVYSSGYLSPNIESIVDEKGFFNCKIIPISNHEQQKLKRNGELPTGKVELKINDSATEGEIFSILKISVQSGVASKELVVPVHAYIPYDVELIPKKIFFGSVSTSQKAIRNAKINNDHKRFLSDKNIQFITTHDFVTCSSKVVNSEWNLNVEMLLPEQIEKGLIKGEIKCVDNTETLFILPYLAVVN